MSVLSKIAEEEKKKSESLYAQTLICNDNYNIKSKQADNWKKEYEGCRKELGKCEGLPWWKIDLKSAGAGILLTLLVIGI